MKAESTEHSSSSYPFMDARITGSVINGLGAVEGASTQPKPRAGQGVGEVLKRLPSTEELEPFFSRLRGVDLILATLSYGLRVSVSDLQGLRIRDVNLTARQVVLQGVARPLPALIIDDIREYVHERLCGSEASVTVSKREQKLFTDGDLSGFFAQVAAYQRGIPDGDRTQGVLTDGCLNRIFRVLGRYHARRAVRRGAKVRSPLELFDKGPKIIRRGRCGVVDAYYLWRTVYPICG